MLPWFVVSVVQYCCGRYLVAHRKNDNKGDDCQDKGDRVPSAQQKYCINIKIPLSHFYICFADIGTRGDEISGNIETNIETEADAAVNESESVSISDASSSRQDLSNIDNTINVKKNIAGEFPVK